MKKFLVFIFMLSMIWLSSCSLNTEGPSTNTTYLSNTETTDNSSITIIESTRENTDASALSTVFAEPKLDMSMVAEVYRLNQIEVFKCNEYFSDEYIEFRGHKYYELNDKFPYKTLDEYRAVLEKVFPKETVDSRLSFFMEKDDKLYLYQYIDKINYQHFYQETYDFSKATYSYKESDDTCDNFIVKVPVEGKDKIQIIYVNIQKSSGKIDGFTFLDNEDIGY